MRYCAKDEKDKHKIWIESIVMAKSKEKVNLTQTGQTFFRRQRIPVSCK